MYFVRVWWTSHFVKLFKADRMRITGWPPPLVLDQIGLAYHRRVENRCGRTGCFCGFIAVRYYVFTGHVDVRRRLSCVLDGLATFHRGNYASGNGDARIRSEMYGRSSPGTKGGESKNTSGKRLGSKKTEIKGR